MMLAGLLFPAQLWAQKATDVASLPAMRVYDNAIMGCMKEVTNVDPLEAVRTKNTQALNMNAKTFLRIQDCMNKKGIPTNFENYYTGSNKGELSAARRADLKAIQDVLDSGKAPVSAPAFKPAPGMSAPPQALPVKPVPPAVAPAPPQEKGEQKLDKPEKQEAEKPASPARKYWVTPE